MKNTNILSADFDKALTTLEDQLTKQNVQTTLLKLSRLVKGSRGFRDSWSAIVNDVLWFDNRHIVPSDAAFSDYDNAYDEDSNDTHSEDGMFLINHDPNYAFYVYENHDGHFKPVSVRDAKDTIDYIKSCLSSIDDRIVAMSETMY